MDAEAGPTHAQTTWRRACAAFGASVFAFVIWLSLRAYGGRLPTWVPQQTGADKLGHFALFGSLSFFLDGALGYRPASARRAWLHLAPLLLWCAVAFEEWAQRFSKARTSEWADLAADTAGIVLGAIASHAIDRWLGRRAPLASQPSGGE